MELQETCQLDLILSKHNCTTWKIQHFTTLSPWWFRNAEDCLGFGTPVSKTCNIIIIMTIGINFNMDSSLKRTVIDLIATFFLAHRSINPFPSETLRRDSTTFASTSTTSRGVSETAMGSWWRGGEDTKLPGKFSGSDFFWGKQMYDAKFPWISKWIIFISFPDLRRRFHLKFGSLAEEVHKFERSLQNLGRFS